MGKRLIQQARGAGGPTYRAPSFRYKSKAKHKPFDGKDASGEVVGLMHCPGHSAPLAQIKDIDGCEYFIIAPEGIKKGDVLKSGSKVQARVGNTVSLQHLPEGTLLYNIESEPGDGGKYCRASGTFARLVSHRKGKVIIELPSKKQKLFHSQCRATIGIVAGGGRTEKPFLKAGIRYYRMKARNKKYPIMSGAAQNAVDHPFGNKRTSRKSKARPVARNAPPGRKVGMIAARRTGRKVHRVKRELQ
ncbi:MAG: 50S ribosomal protein L2 [Candidatus Woesearchaeota archaeon]|jgi:large subunit ribosomal protein L2|nr:50S ribosomal protein L2 [Candidatus Woesearchaeota archaeon]MDP7324338.1 50S ribosomal protein L2 [Candidatus Woesearchaeota archaeon]MDP7457942.1 50S ribosomal protein L2 [Candidatus Woesearchaeota archaeon]